MHRTHAGHGSIWPAETSDGMFASTMPTTADLAAANYARKTAERERDEALALATRAREDALREASKVAAFGDLPQGLSGSTRDAVAKAILALIDKPKPLPAAPVDGGEDA